MAIGYNWAEGSYADTSWTTTAWALVALVWVTAKDRVQAVIGYTRTQIVAFSDRVHAVSGSW